MSDDGPGAYANVVVMGTRRGAQSDEQGRFVITLVPPGRRQIKTYLLGHEMSFDSVVVEAGRVIDVGKLKAGKKKVVKMVMD